MYCGPRNFYEYLYCDPRIFLYRQREGTSTTFKILYAYVKEFSFLLLNVYQSTQENARGREEIFKKPSLLWHGVSVEFARFNEMISVEN